MKFLNGLILSLLPAVVLASNSPTPVSLFDGSTLDGWHLACKPGDAAKARAFWRVEDCTIVCDTAGDKEHDYIWLVSDREYGDFELTLEAKSRSGGNSGVQVRSRYDEDEGWLNGPQVDIDPGTGWRCGFIYDETRGEQRWLNPDLPDWKIDEKFAVKGWSWDREGWNTLRIRCKGTVIEAEVNGVCISRYDGAGTLDDENHAKRKVGMKGHIALQLHMNNDLKIAFRNIRILENL